MVGEPTIWSAAKSVSQENALTKLFDASNSGNSGGLERSESLHGANKKESSDVQRTNGQLPLERGAIYRTHVARSRSQDDRPTRQSKCRIK